MFTLILEIAGGIVLGAYALRAIPRILGWLRRVLAWAFAWLVVYPLVTAATYALVCAAVAAWVAGLVGLVGWCERHSPYLGAGAFAGVVALHGYLARLYLTRRAKAAQDQVRRMAEEVRTRREAQEAEASRSRPAADTPFVGGLDYLGTMALANSGISKPQ